MLGFAFLIIGSIFMSGLLLGWYMRDDTKAIIGRKDANGVGIPATIEIAGHTFPLTLDRLYAAEYARAGKRYPQPRTRKSKMRMSKKWRMYE